jgi:hypothetical protein
MKSHSSKSGVSSTPKARPYWHVDVKWISGILLFFALSSALLFYNLATLTSRDTAVALSANVVASLFSRDGLDDEAGLVEFRQQAVKSQSEKVVPVPQFPGVSITKQQALTLKARDLRIAIFSQITGPIYDLGVVGAAKQFVNKPADQAAFVRQASVLSVFTKQTHSAMLAGFWIAAFLSVLFIAALVFFSAGWGRLVSPGILFAIVSPLGSAASLILSFPPRDGTSLAASLPETVTHTVGQSLGVTYLSVFIAGIVLLLAAAIGKIIHRTRVHRLHEDNEG